MTIQAFIHQQIASRQDPLSRLHDIILGSDKTVGATVEPMMGQDMIVYKAGGLFKYGLASVKSHISLHVLPIYGSADLHARYQKLLPGAKFQKGCINFTDGTDVPFEMVQKLISDCSTIDLAAQREEYLKSKRKK